MYRNPMRVEFSSLEDARAEFKSWTVKESNWYSGYLVELADGRECLMRELPGSDKVAFYFPRG